MQPPKPEKQSAAYREQHRPQFHFSPREKWMNDPNGMVYLDGEYHLFYQFYPDSSVWGPMHWGHAVSRDLAGWEHLPVALYPDSLGYIFSGSVVVDRENSSGFGRDGQPALVAIFTYHNMAAEKAGRSDYQYQGIAYSNDKGRTWTKYPGNPVIPNPGQVRDFRDPKVLRDEANGQWVMTLAVKDHIEFWASKDLKRWQHLSDFGKEWGAHGGVWECPDLFPIKESSGGDTKWVLLVSINPGAPNGGSGTQYFVGHFDGKTFTPDESFRSAATGGKAVWLDYGRDNYAGVTWSGIPEGDGRRIFLGWMSNWDYAQTVPTTAWRSAMTLPRSLSLERTPEGYRLFSRPVAESEALRLDARRLPGTEITATLDLTEHIGFAPSQLELLLELEPSAEAARFGVELSNSKGERYRVGYDAANRQYFSDRTRAGDASFSPKFAAAVHTAPRISTDKTVRLHLFFDVASAELFADGGATAMTDVIFPGEVFSTVKIFTEKGKVKLLKGEAYSLARIWD